MDGPDKKNELEKRKYEWLNENCPPYGQSNHGEKYIKFLQSANFESLLDVGTGKGQMCYEVSKRYKKVYGLDWGIKPDESCKNANIEFINADAQSIPLPDNSVDVTTSFDFLEHVIPENIDKVISEIARVTKSWLLNTIGTGPSKSRRKQLEEIFGDGELHQTQKSKEWWIKVLSKHGETLEFADGGLLTLIS